MGWLVRDRFGLVALSPTSTRTAPTFAPVLARTLAPAPAPAPALTLAPLPIAPTSIAPIPMRVINVPPATAAALLASPTAGALAPPTFAPAPTSPVPVVSSFLKLPAPMPIPIPVSAQSPTTFVSITAPAPAPVAVVAAVSDTVGPAILPSGEMIYSPPRVGFTSGTSGKIGTVMPSGGIAVTSGRSEPPPSSNPYKGSAGPAADSVSDGGPVVLPDGTMVVGAADVAKALARPAAGNGAKWVVGLAAGAGLLWFLTRRRR